MSVGDIKGARRRFKDRQKKGHAPKKSGLNVAQSIARHRAIAARNRAIDARAANVAKSK